MGRQSGNTFRTTISIPTDLKARMEAAGEQVNWSAVAVRAFEEKLAEIATRKKDKTMQDVIQKLRASKLRGEDSKYKAGRTAGRAWATSPPEVEELQNLQAVLDKLDGDPTFGRDEFFDVESSTYSTAECLFFGIHPENNGDRQAANDFWESVLGSNATFANSKSFLRGFAEGAEAFWLEVRDRL